MLAMVLLAMFLGIWAGAAVIARRRNQSWTIALGGGFLGSSFALAAVSAVSMAVQGNGSSEAEAQATSPQRAEDVLPSSNQRNTLRQKDLYDPSVPIAQREAQVRRLIVGKFHGMTQFGPSNYSLNDDGTFISTWCIPYGEVSERKFTPNASGQWHVEEKRYRDTGKIFYGILVTEPKDDIAVMQLLVDRDDGLLINNGGDGQARTEPGHTTFCGT